jgi:DNA-binding NarL/FixJ family response regulator
VLVANSHARRVDMYPRNFHPDLIDAAHHLGVDGYLPKTLPARDLVTAVQHVHAGQTVISQPPTRARTPSGLDRPERSEGFTDRASEILTLINHGKSNAEVDRSTYRKPNTVKSYIRATYRKVGAPSPTAPVVGIAFPADRLADPRHAHHGQASRMSISRHTSHAPPGALTAPGAVGS